MTSRRFSRRQMLGGLLGIMPALGCKPAHSTAPDHAPLTRPSPAVISRQQWGALAPDHSALYEHGLFSDDNPTGWRVYEAPLSEVYRTVVLHHSVIYEADDAATMLEVQRFQREERGWADVAYHYFVGKSGTIYEGRRLNVRGAHVGGYNTGSLGLCLLGDFSEDSAPTEPQLSSTRQMLAWLTQTLALTHIAGHRDFNPATVCPGDQLAALIDGLALDAGLTVGTGGYQAPA